MRIRQGTRVLGCLLFGPGQCAHASRPSGKPSDQLSGLVQFNAELIHRIVVSDLDKVFLQTSFRFSIKFSDIY